MTRENKRRIKKRILAEVLAVYREQQFTVRGTIMQDDGTGTYRAVAYRYAPPIDWWNEVLHQCARLEGKFP